MTLSRKLSKYLLPLALVVATQTVYAPVAHAKKVQKSEEQVALEKKYKKRKTYIIGESIGKKVTKAFELYSADKVVEAIEVLEKIKTKKQFDRAYVDRFLGNLYAAQDGQAKTAINYLSSAVKPDLLNATEQAQAIRLLADLQMQERMYAACLLTYQQWMDFTGRQDKAVYLRMSQAKYELKQYADMIPLLDKAIAIAKSPDKNAYVLKLSSYYECKDYKNSIKVLETLVKLFPEDSRWWPQLGMFYMMVEDYSRALATMDLAYKQGLLTKPNQVKALSQLYYNNNVPYKAAKILEKHIDDGLIERDLRMVTQLANSYRAAKEYDTAAKYYAEAGAFENDPEMYRKQGNMLLQKERYKDAITALEKSLELGTKKKGSVHMMMAESYLYQNKLRSAYKYIKLAEQDPKTKKNAKSWAGYIKSKAQQKGIKI